MLPVAGQPFVDHKLAELRRAGIHDVLMLVGHAADPLRAHVGDGSKHGLSVTFVDDGDQLLGTGGAIKKAVPQLGDAFFVTYGDTLVDLRVDYLAQRLSAPGAMGVMAVLKNDDRWETSNVDLEDDYVVAYEKRASPGRHHYLDYGFLAFNADVFEEISDESFDLAVPMQRLVLRRALVAFLVRARFHDIGNEAAVRETEAWLLSGKQT
jgi:NDP-sugar pyrophosphorylase family protein